MIGFGRRKRKAYSNQRPAITSPLNVNEKNSARNVRIRITPQGWFAIDYRVQAKHGSRAIRNISYQLTRVFFSVRIFRRFSTLFCVTDSFQA